MCSAAHVPPAGSGARRAITEGRPCFVKRTGWDPRPVPPGPSRRDGGVPFTERRFPEAKRHPPRRVCPSAAPLLPFPGGQDKYQRKQYKQCYKSDDVGWRHGVDPPGSGEPRGR